MRDRSLASLGIGGVVDLQQFKLRFSYSISVGVACYVNSLSFVRREQKRMGEH